MAARGRNSAPDQETPDWERLPRLKRRGRALRPAAGKPASPTLRAGFARFCALGSGLRLRSYQREVAEALLESLELRDGRALVVLFPRQSGKNELQAQLEAYLLYRLRRAQAEVVVVSPTWKPQSQNAQRRLERVLQRNKQTRGRWQREAGYIYRLGAARVIFLSGAPTANVVGATANTLLVCDEAQDVLIEKWDKEIAPMAASTNATRAFFGTAWTAHTLLGRELRFARLAEQADGRRRVFVVDAERVGAEVPAYAAFVRNEIQRLGRGHPMVRTQFFCEELESAGGLLPPERLALLAGSHPRQRLPKPGQVVAFLLDVAGADEQAGAAQGDTRRDSTALTIVQVDAGGLDDPLVGAPIYRVLERAVWTNLPHPALYARLRALAEAWGAWQVVVDATGIGAGLAAFLGRSLQGQVRPFIFTQASKSALGWRLIQLIESGRLKDWQAGGAEDAERQLFLRQAAGCQAQVLPGPGRTLRWGVPDGVRDAQDGSPLHDDLLVSLALVGALEEERLEPGRSSWLPGEDPLGGMRNAI